MLVDWGRRIENGEVNPASLKSMKRGLWVGSLHKDPYLQPDDLSESPGNPHSRRELSPGKSDLPIRAVAHTHIQTYK